MSTANYSNTSLDEFKSQINIVDVVGRAVQLKRAGSNFKGCCPFHNEKTPSFVVSEQKQIFTCFGCGASGDVVGFTKRFYNLEFREAVEKLSQEYGIKYEFAAKKNDGRERLYEINKMAARFFYDCFTRSANPGYTYMKERGIEDSILKKFGIGYADGNWDSLYKYLKSKGVDEKTMVELGLLSEKNGKYYDKFRDRVMFPIINTSGKVIGFGGRTINGSEPKYLNSPENAVFQKKNNLYALNITRQDIGREKYAIMVEGYMDVIGLYQAGVHNVAASLGTALTENQSKLIKRYAQNVVLSYDADNAGRNAALRGIDVLGKEDLNVKVLHVTDGKDPDEFVKKNGREAFIKLIDSSLPAIDYKIDAQRRSVNMETETGKIEFIKRAAQVLRELSPVQADIYARKISRENGISEGALRLEIEGRKPEKPVQNRPNANDEQHSEKISNLEASVLKAMCINPALIEELLGSEGMFESRLAVKTMNLMFEIYGTTGSFSEQEVSDRLEPDESLALRHVLDNVIISGNEDQVFRDCINSYKLWKAKKREKELIDRLALSDDESNEDVLNRLTAELMEIQKFINNRGGR